MPLAALYSLADRRNEKRASREQDDSDLRSGVMSRDDLRLQNGAFSAFDIAGASIRRRR